MRESLGVAPSGDKSIGQTNLITPYKYPYWSEENMLKIKTDSFFHRISAFWRGQDKLYVVILSNLFRKIFFSVILLHLLCGEKYVDVKYITMHVVPRKHFFNIFLKLWRGRFIITRKSSWLIKVLKWIIEWPFLPIHTDLCEGTRKELPWSIMLITRSIRVTPWMYYLCALTRRSCCPTNAKSRDPWIRYICSL